MEINRKIIILWRLHPEEMPWRDPKASVSSSGSPSWGASTQRRLLGPDAVAHTGCSVSPTRATPQPPERGSRAEHEEGVIIDAVFPGCDLTCRAHRRV